MNPVIAALSKSKDFEAPKDAPEEDDCEEEEVDDGVKVSRGAVAAAKEFQSVLKVGDAKSIALALKNLIRECK